MPVFAQPLESGSIHLIGPNIFHAPIEQIAEEVGCASTYRFYSHFQQKMGMTPAEYRSRHQADSCVPEP
ncbi:AraC family transcriptional regulator [Paenibacillus hemerocallicola]|uniref:AraC family transcriptional regulator n=1 Tax=Paenibacillus hemerocallicola TaxID=1172614 RepID=UPI003CCC6468